MQDELVRVNVTWVMNYKYVTLHVISACTKMNGYGPMNMSWMA